MKNIFAIVFYVALAFGLMCSCRKVDSPVPTTLSDSLDPDSLPCGRGYILTQPGTPLPGVFTVADPDGVPGSGDEKRVQFSHGNLASLAETEQWGIFANQYDCLETPWYSGVHTLVSLYEPGDLSTRGPYGDGAQTSFSFDVFDFGQIAFPGSGWRMLSAQEWSYLFGMVFQGFYEIDESNPRRNLYRVGVEVMGRNCVVLYPDNYQGTKEETFNTEQDYIDATNAGIVFLPLAGMCAHSSPIEGFGVQGFYWSNTPNGWDYMYRILIDESDFIDLSPVKIRRYFSVRLVKDYIPAN